MLVGARHDGSSFAGRAYLFCAPVAGTVDVADATATFTGHTAGDSLGHVAGAGDANGDGHIDILLGADGVKAESPYTGAVYLFEGGGL